MERSLHPTRAHSCGILAPVELSTAQARRGTPRRECNCAGEPGGKIGDTITVHIAGDDHVGDGGLVAKFSSTMREDAGPDEAEHLIARRGGVGIDRAQVAAGNPPCTSRVIIRKDATVPGNAAS